MRLLLRALPISLVLMAVAAGTAVAQEDPPSAPDIVAQVGEEAIAKVELDEWLAQAAYAQFRRPVAMVPPRYGQCVAATRAARAAKGWRKLGARALRKRCRRHHRTLRRQTLAFLVQARWIEQEAAARGVDIGAGRVDRAFSRHKRRAFPTSRAYRRFLRESGATESHIEYRVRLDLLQRAVTQDVASEIRPVTRRDIARYRARRRDRFAAIRRVRANRKIRAEIVAWRQQRVVGRFVADFHERYVAITWCAPGHRIDECGAPTPA